MSWRSLRWHLPKPGQIWCDLRVPWASHNEQANYQLRLYFQEPTRGDLQRLRKAGRGAIGIDTRGDILADAKIEIWQANHFGLYDLDGYRYRASLSADLAGQYSFDSVMPGHYPARVCQHIHYVVTAPGHKPLITQLYFATDPVFEGDPDRNYSRDPLVMSRELVRPVTLSGDPKAIQANVTFELGLERL